MAKEDYILQEFPDDATLERAAKQCSLLAVCPDRPFSFCLKSWVNVNHNLMFRKITYKHCWECQHGIEREAQNSA